MSTGFIVISSDEADRLAVSLDAALAEGFDTGLVIDNGSRDATPTVAATRGLEILTLPRRVPYTEAMNAGLDRLLADVDRPDVVALLQADTFLSPGYLAACLTALAGRPDVGSVAPKLLRTLGSAREDELGEIDAAAMSFDRRRKNSLVGHGRPARDYGRPAEVFGADGAAALWRSAALLDCAVDGQIFDANMPGWGCDADLAWRAQLLGWHAVYAPAAVVRHIRRYSPSTRASTGPEDRATQFANRLIMVVKNDSWIDLRHHLGAVLRYELLALGYALVREHELLGAYRDAWRRLPEARRQRRIIQGRRRTRRVPFGLSPPQE